MKLMDVVKDHNLDARDNGDGSYTATCPVCGQMGGLQLNMRQETFRCRVARCKVSGDGTTLDRLYRQKGVRKRWQIHPGIADEEHA